MVQELRKVSSSCTGTGAVAKAGLVAAAPRLQRLNVALGSPPEATWAGSSVGQSSGLIIRRSEVRVLPGPWLCQAESAALRGGASARWATEWATPRQRDPRLKEPRPDENPWRTVASD